MCMHKLKAVFSVGLGKGWSRVHCIWQGQGTSSSSGSSGLQEMLG